MIEIKRRWHSRAQYINHPKLVARIIPGVCHYFPIYTKKEADDLKLPYVYWKHIEGDMDWMMTDDEYVMQAIYVKYYARAGGSANKLVSSAACGKRFVSPGARMLFEAQMNVRNFTVHASKMEIGYLLKLKAVKLAMYTYCHTILHGSSNIDIIYRIIKKNDVVKGRKIWNFILSTLEGKRTLDREMQNILATKGITREWVLDVQLDALNIARDKKDALTMVKIVDSIVKVSGLDKPKQEDDFFIGELNESSTNNRLIEAGFTEVREDDDANDLLCEEPGSTQGPDEDPAGQDEEEAEPCSASGAWEEHPDSGGIPSAPPVC